jgi:uncharacterized damage-inducible protein DinB
MTEQSTLLARYADGPRQLEAALDGLDEASLDLAPPEGGGWTIRQIVHHVVDGDHLWSIVLKAALGNPQSAFSFSWYWETEQNQWAETWAYAQRDIEPSLALFRATRQQIVAMLKQIPDPWGRQMRVCWPDGEEETVSVADVAADQSRHVIGHVEDIQKIRQVHGL